MVRYPLLSRLFVSMWLLTTLSIQGQEPSPVGTAPLPDDKVVKRFEELGGKIARDKLLPGMPTVEIDLSGTTVTDADLSHLIIAI
jgi:hypothetical protein